MMKNMENKMNRELFIKLANKVYDEVIVGARMDVETGKEILGVALTVKKLEDA